MSVHFINVLPIGVGQTKCFLTSTGAKYYFYAPIFALLCVNCVVYAMTVYDLWRSHQEIEVAILSRRITRRRNEVDLGKN